MNILLHTHELANRIADAIDVAELDWTEGTLKVTGVTVREPGHKNRVVVEWEVNNERAGSSEGNDIGADET